MPPKKKRDSMDLLKAVHRTNAENALGYMREKSGHNARKRFRDANERSGDTLDRIMQTKLQIAKMKKQAKTIDVRGVEEMLAHDLATEDGRPPKKQALLRGEYEKRNSPRGEDNIPPERFSLPVTKRSKKKKQNNPERVAMALRGR